MSLIELMITVSLLALVLGAVLALMDAGASQLPKDQERAHAMREAQVGLDRMVRELRQSYFVRSTTPNAMDVYVRLNGQSRHVHWTCNVRAPDTPENPYDQNYRRCIRREAGIFQPLPSIASGEVVVDRVVNGATPVFEFTPNPIRPTYVTVRLEVPARGGLIDGFKHKVTFNDGFLLRNVTVGT